MNFALSDRALSLCLLLCCLKDRMQEINWFVCLFVALLSDKSWMEIQIYWNSVKCTCTIYWLVLSIQNDFSSEKADMEKFALCEDLYMIWLYVTWLTVEIKLTAHIKLARAGTVFTLFCSSVSLMHRHFFICFSWEGYIVSGPGLCGTAQHEWPTQSSVLTRC